MNSIAKSDLTLAFSNVDRSKDTATVGSLHRAWTLEQALAAALVFAIVFVNGADFRGDTGEEFSIHWQIYLRLAVCAAAGAYGTLALFGRTFREFFTFPGALLSGYVVINGLSILVSQQRTYTLAAWLSLVGVALFVPAAMKSLGGRKLMLTIAFSLCIYLLGSWVAFLYFPDIGVFHEQVTQSDVFARMGGLAHPNELGFYSAYAAIVICALYATRQVSAPVAAMGSLLALLTIYSSFSRTAAIACSVGLAVTFGASLRRPGNVVGMLLLAGLVTLVLFGLLGMGQLDWLVDSWATKLTKSGNLDELATATGRTEIWVAAISFIQESPLLGYGYCSARFVMEDYSYHGHNILLNAMLYAGIGGGLIVGAILLHLFWSALVDPRPAIDGLVACMFAAGMVDGVLASASPTAMMLIWTVALLWRQLGMMADE